MTHTAEITVAREEGRKPEMNKAEVCFGAVMAISAISGMWLVVSLMINYLMAG